MNRSISLLDGLEVALDIMKNGNIHGSFFVVGEIADRLRVIDKEEMTLLSTTARTFVP